MRNRLRGIALRQQGITEQLMSGRHVGIELDRVFQWRNGRAQIVLLHISLPEADKTLGESRFELSHFSELGDGNIDLLLFFSVDSSLHVLSGLGRQSLRCKPKK